MPTPHGHRGSAARWWSGLPARATAITVLACAALVAVVLPATPAQALVVANRVAGWNMQGANSNRENNWANQVLGLASRHSVVALQEAGAMPASSTDVVGGVLPGGTWTAPGGYEILERIWNRRYLYYVQVGDSPGTRTNMAIVTTVRASRVFILPPQGALGAGRPSFGVEVPDTFVSNTSSTFWNVHAQSFGSAGALHNDAIAVVGAIRAEMIGQGVASWAAIGDFNRDPATQLAPHLPAGANLRVISTGTATHFGANGNSALDAMVTNDDNFGLNAIPNGGGVSDHVAISFGFQLRAAADASGQISQAGPSGTCVAVVEDVSPTILRVDDCAETIDQNWTHLNDNTLRHQGRCLTAPAGNSPSDSKVDLRDCTGSATQTWALRSDGTLRHLGSESCLDGKPTGLSMSAQCNDPTTDQLWMVPVPTGPVRMKEASNTCLDASREPSVILQACTTAAAHSTQSWAFHNNGTVHNNGACLGSQPETDGPTGQEVWTVVLTACTDAGAGAQQWQQVDNDLVNSTTGLCLDSRTGHQEWLLRLTSCTSPTGTPSPQPDPWLWPSTSGRIRTQDASHACFLTSGDQGTESDAHVSCGQPGGTLDWELTADGTLRQGSRCLSYGLDPFDVGVNNMKPCDSDTDKRLWRPAPDGTLATLEGPERCLTTVGDQLALGTCDNAQRWIFLGDNAAPPAEGKPFGYTTTFPGESPVARVVYLRNGHIHELKLTTTGWRHTDLSAVAGAPAADSYPMGYLSNLAGQGPVARVIYRDGDGHVHELFLVPGRTWQHADLTAITRSTPALTGHRGWQPKGYTSDLANQGIVARVVYVGHDHNIHELVLKPSSYWQPANLTAIARAPRAVSIPWAFTSNVSSQGPAVHVVYTSSGGRVHELSLSSHTSAWGHNDLGAIAGAPVAAGIVAGYGTNLIGEGPAARVLYHTADRHIHELSLKRYGSWRHRDLMEAATAAPSSTADLFGYTVDVPGDPIAGVVYLSGDGHLYQLYRNTGADWRYGDITVIANAPPAGSSPMGYSTNLIDDDPAANQGGPAARVLYLTADGHIHELRWRARPSWRHTDLTLASTPT